MIKIILLTVAAFLLAYGVGSFVAADFNIAEWNPLGRIFIAAMGGFFAAFSLMIYNAYIKGML